MNNLLGQDMLVRIIENDHLDDTDRIRVCRLKRAFNTQFTRDSDIIEMYEDTNAEDIGGGDFLVDKEEKFASSVILPSTVQDFIDNYGVEPDVEHGMFLKWAIAHSSLSTVIYLLSKHKDKMIEYVDSAIIDGISHGSIPFSILDYLIDHCGYDIHKNDENLFTLCAMRKNYNMSRYLLDRGANIPTGVFRAFQLNARKFKAMWDLIKEYRHMIIGGGL